MKAHHCFTDGLGWGTFFLSLSDKYDSEALPTLKPLPWDKWLLKTLLYPYLLLKSTFTLLFIPSENNPIKKPVPMSGIKNGAFTCDLDISKMKKYCHSRNCTINDYLTAVLSCSMHEYMGRHKTFNRKEY